MAIPVLDVDGASLAVGTVGVRTRYTVVEEYGDTNRVLLEGPDGRTIHALGAQLEQAEGPSKLTLQAISTPATPAAGTICVYAKTIDGKDHIIALGSDGVETSIMGLL